MVGAEQTGAYGDEVRKLIAAVCVAAIALLPGCAKNREPNSLFDAAGYHVRGDKVYYLRAFPGDAFEITGADAASFQVLDGTYARDTSTVFVDGVALPNADAATFQVLDRPGFAKDANHVYRRDAVASDDPDGFAFLDADLTRDSTHVYWVDGSVLSDDPGHFEIVSTVDYYTYTKDLGAVHVNGSAIVGADPASFRVLRGAYSRDDETVFYFTDAMPTADAGSLEVLEGPYARDGGHAYWMGKAIPGADPASFQVLNANFECSADTSRAYYRDGVIADADPSTFPPGKSVTNCSETFISFSP